MYLSANDTNLTFCMEELQTGSKLKLAWDFKAWQSYFYQLYSRAWLGNMIFYVFLFLLI